MGCLLREPAGNVDGEATYMGARGDRQVHFATNAILPPCPCANVTAVASTTVGEGGTYASLVGDGDRIPSPLDEGNIGRGVLTWRT